MQPERRQQDDPQQNMHPGWREEDHLIRLLVDNARDHGDEVALRERDRGIWKEYTWRDYLEKVMDMATGMEACGVAPGDRILVIGDNRPALYLGMVAAVTLRAIPSPAYPDTPPEEIRRQMEAEAIRCALVEDQEQVDKLLGIREQGYDRLKTLVFDDPRGLEGQEPEGGMSVADLCARGRSLRMRRPGLDADLQSRASVHDTAVLLHSSGTTGAPKGVPIKHGHILSGVRNAAAAGYFQEGEEHMAYLPMAWVGDFIFSIGAALALRFTVNIPEKQETALHDLREIAPTLYFSSPRAWSNMLTRIQVGINESSPLKRRLYHHFMPFAVELERRRLEGCAPTALERLWRRVGEMMIYGPVKDHLGLGRVQRAYTAGEAMGEDVFLFFRALGLNLRQFYGQTENCALCAAQDPDSVSLHTAGRPFPGVEVRIHEDGEILVRSENVFDGYFDNPKATAETLQDGWMHTGDAGYLEDDGQLVVLGRVSEVVYTAAGERFIPTYVENRLKFSQYIKDACILGQGRDHLAAMIVIDLEAAGHWAEEQGVAYTSFSDLSQKPEVYELVRGEIAHVNAVLPQGLKIRRFVNLHKEFDPDDGEVTRTRKLRRKVIDQHYAPIIEALYDGRTALEFEAHIRYESGESGTLKRHLAVADIPLAHAAKEA
ncbi:AMP-dependent synthetase/ligase [Ectothiorhodospira mobilis]|uniref:AMP-dependent synthetase/ligase n=1 Tax=Ectothiorhodospira mobilis TaxID=195064 RepID=UPI001EE8C7A2|nr:AMP-binding protein [Ectothiorhodospira mobilis]MCG5534735.1 AMP-binding protein [Ectothiorhodospira mobilis]